MKKIDFPQPVHEQAVEVLEEARKKLAALGYLADYCSSMGCSNTLAEKNKGWVSFDLHAEITC